MARTKILNHRQIEQKITRIAYEIYENHHEEKELVFVGIEKRGMQLANMIAKEVKEVSGLKVTTHSLKINKDEPLKSPEHKLTEKDLADKVVLLVDDVLNTGRVLAWGVKFLLDFPVKKLKTIILVNRRHRKFPIRADYVGMTLATTMQEHITVELKDKENAVYLK